MGGSSRHFSLHNIYSAGNPPKKKSNPLSLTSTTSHFPSPLFHRHDNRNRTSPPHFSGGLPDTPLDQTLLNRRHRPSPQNIPAEPRNHTLIQGSFPEPLQLRSRPPHRSRFADTFIHRTGSSSPSAPEPRYRCPRALTGTNAAVHESTCLCSRLAVTFCRCDEQA